mmetsp:Transcript_18426/g.28699  ORF Transcript_18426/g.28699 Transcript_18426/m.28699 type:complete len:143 (+) Transcript_18426:777-1205(+)
MVTQAFLGNLGGKLKDTVPLIARCHTLDNIMYALLHRGAACGLMCQLGYQKGSQYAFLVGILTYQLHTNGIRDCIQADAALEQIRAHYILNEYGTIVQTFSKQCSNYSLVSAVMTYKAIGSEPFKQALKCIQKLPNFVYSVC